MSRRHRRDGPLRRPPEPLNRYLTDAFLTSSSAAGLSSYASRQVAVKSL